MKINLIGMILNTTQHNTFTEEVIVDDDGNPLSAEESLDFMIMEYAKVKNGGTSNVVTVPSRFLKRQE